jgi:demethoxyubiquinone hydroxylase (CLK1/Coq7/Cat5 family)
MDITREELTVLNFYRASELQGGLLLAGLSARVRDPGLMIQLAHHGAEEVVHSQLWAETIVAVGARPWPTSDTYQSRYAAALGHPVGLLDVLALTQVFERRVYRHFTEHLRRPGTHPVVQATLRRMLDDERGHLLWVKRWLDRQAESRPERVRETMRRYAEVDRQVYDVLTAELGWRRAA